MDAVLASSSLLPNPVLPNNVVVGDDPEDDAFLTSKDWKKLAKTSCEGPPGWFTPIGLPRFVSMLGKAVPELTLVAVLLEFVVVELELEDNFGLSNDDSYMCIRLDIA